MMNKKAIVIDGNSMFYRMYYATAKQVDYAIANNYVPNNAIKLMLNTIIKLMQQTDVEYFFIAFDAAKKTFRHELLDSYKKDRAKTPDELIKQMNDTILALRALGINVQAKESIEADDLVGSFVHLMNQANINVDVYSSDKDLLQLVNEYTNVHLMKTGISELDVYTLDNFKQKFFNLTPTQVIDYKAIIGDNSDHLPGVKGIGIKIGIHLLNTYGSLDNIYNHLDELTNATKNKFVEAKDMAYLCKKLATIIKDEFNHEDLNNFKIKTVDYETLLPILDKYKLAKIKDELFNLNQKE